jgi:hypothetical protein
MGTNIMQYASLELFNGCPPFFQEFNDKLVQDDDGRQTARTNRINLSQTGMGLHYVKGLQSAASKWRLAQSVTGLAYKNGSEFSSDLMDSYSAQARVSLSVVAFEAFARIFKGGDWPTAKAVVLKKPDSKLCDETRQMLSNGDILKKLSGQPANAQQKIRLADFQIDQDEELYPVCVAIRNSFTHGSIGGWSELVDLAPKMQAFILDGIQEYCCELIKK